MANRVRHQRQWIAAFLVIAAALLAPATASGIEVRTSQVQTDALLITADRSVVNDVGFNWVTSPGGAPDLVIGDTAAGIPDPIPTACARVDAMILRCPANTFTSIQVFLGGGNDLVVVPKPSIAVSGFITMELHLGPGNDTASDLGGTRDVWNGGPGRDRLNSGPGNDLVRGGADNDVIDCGAGKHDVGIGGPGKLDLSRHCEVVKP